jgi:hypothetical protein
VGGPVPAGGGGAAKVVELKQRRVE